MTQIKLAVFDIAGTTVVDDNAVADAFMKAFEIYGYSISHEEINHLMGYKKTDAIKAMLGKMNMNANEDLIKHIYREFETQMLDHYEYSPDVKPMKGAEEVLLELREKGIRIALNTGFSKEVADAIMNRLQWKEKGIVNDYIASDEVETGRPQPFMIHALMEDAGIYNPEAVAKIGDTEADIKEGRNARCGLVVAVTTGAFSREQLETFSPDFIVDDLSEILPLIISRE